MNDVLGKEFKLYLLIKKFYFDSKLYKFISQSVFSTMNIEEQHRNSHL